MSNTFTRRRLLAGSAAAVTALPLSLSAATRDLRIKDVKITPIALPDPPLLAASGCHGPYFLRTIVEVFTDDGIVGVGETYGGENTIKQLHAMANAVKGQSVFAYRAPELATVEAVARRGSERLASSVTAAFEMARLDIAGQATGCRVCDLLGGPVRNEVAFAAYLFYRYAADDPRVLSDERLADDRGKGDNALDHWGEVRSAEAMTELAAGFRDKFGFQVLKLKAGVLKPDEELKTLRMWHERFGDDVLLRIDPNGQWTVPTAISAGRQLHEVPLEYYEDPVAGQRAMADVRNQTGLPMATNSCVSRWEHLETAVTNKPIDVVLADIYWFGGLTGVQALARACDSLGWGVGYHSNNHAGITMAAMIHAGASTPEMQYALDTHYVWLPEGKDIIQGNNLLIQGGKMQIPGGPGLGVKIDQDKLSQAHETYVKCGMRDRDDGQTMKRFEPGWKRILY